MYAKISAKSPVTHGLLLAAADAVGVRLIDVDHKPHGWVRFRLAPVMARTVGPRGGVTQRPLRYAKRSTRGRRTSNGICWHGHRDFMREVYKYQTTARFRSAVAKYNDREHFERTYAASIYGDMPWLIGDCAESE